MSSGETFEIAMKTESPSGISNRLFYGYDGANYDFDGQDPGIFSMEHSQMSGNGTGTYDGQIPGILYSDG